MPSAFTGPAGDPGAFFRGAKGGNDLRIGKGSRRERLDRGTEGFYAQRQGVAQGPIQIENNGTYHSSNKKAPVGGPVLQCIY